MRAGPIEDVPPPTSGALRSPLSTALAEMQPGQSRTLEPEPGKPVHLFQAMVSNVATRLWGKGGHIQRRTDDGRIRVWRLNEDQRLAVLAAKRARKERRGGC